MVKNQCFMCGKIAGLDFPLYDLQEVKEIWRYTGHKDICNDCCCEANKIIGYYGKKKDEDKKRLKSFMIKGYLPNKEFREIMNSGYY